MSFTQHVVPPKHTSDSASELVGKYQRKTYDVDAVQVTERNIKEVAEWCGGESFMDGPAGPMVRIPVTNASKPTDAKVKDWVLKIPNAGRSKRDVFAIYNEYAFGRAFDPKPVREFSNEELADAVIVNLPKPTEEHFTKPLPDAVDPSQGHLVNVNGSIGYSFPNPHKPKEVEALEKYDESIETVKLENELDDLQENALKSLHRIWVLRRQIAESYTKSH